MWKRIVTFLTARPTHSGKKQMAPVSQVPVQHVSVDEPSLRLQEYRHWFRWKAVVRHDEVFESSEVLECLRDPAKVKTSRAWADTGTFSDFCVLVSELAPDASRVDAPEFAALMIEAARRFGERPMMDVGFGYGPRGALEAVLRNDTADARLRAICLLVKEGSVWLSYRIVMHAVVDAKGTKTRQALPTEERLISGDDALQEVVDIWLDRAWVHIEGTGSDWSTESAYTLAAWIRNIAGPESVPKLKAAIARIVQIGPQGIALIFDESQFGDDRLRNFGMPTQEFLPDTQALLAAADSNLEFSKTRSVLVDFWRKALPGGDVVVPGR